MRYIENGIQDKDGPYFFDNSRFDVQSYFIFFDSTASYVDLAGLMDSSDATFSYTDWNYNTEFISEILSLSEAMFTNLKKFNNISDFTIDASNVPTLEALRLKLLHFIDKINYNNQIATRHDYYDHGISRAFPFAELIIIKLHGTDYIVKTMLNKHITKNIGESDIVYTLNSELYMSKYVYHYSTYQSDYTSLYLKLLYNINDMETVNKESLIVSPVLFPMVRDDSSKLYISIILDSTVADVANKYQLFDVTEDELVYINNKYLCRVSGVIDTTLYDESISSDYTIDSTYLIEFLEFDNTTDLSVYMGGAFEYYDFTRVTYQYFFNFRTIKKLNFGNTYFTDSTNEFFKVIFSTKTFFGYLNRAANEVASDWKEFYTTANTNFPIMYSGSYDITNNVQFNLLSLLNTFSTDKFILPYDVTILKSDISGGTDFTIDLFIANSTDITNFVGNWVRNGIYIFNESGIRDVIVLRANNYEQINANTFRMHFNAVVYDSSWFAGVVGVEYHIPSNSYIVQYKYHIYNVIPYLKLDEFRFSNDLNNLITIHSFGYVVDNPSVLQWNGIGINV